MDIYEFSERDDHSNVQNKKLKHSKRKISEKQQIKTRSLNHKSRIKKSKFIHINNQLENVSKLNPPPLKLKLVRDENDPKTFKSIQLLNDFSPTSDYYFNFSQQPLLKCKLVDRREFAVNNIVWAKISGYPFWPSKILSINRSQKCAQSVNCKPSGNEEFIACVEWLAYDQISYVNCANLSHFHADYDNKYSTKIKNKKYFEAVSEAKQLTDEKSSSDVVVTNQRAIDSEAETSSTLPSHNFTSPESNQSLQSCCLSRPPGANSEPLSNQSDPSVHDSSVVVEQTAALVSSHLLTTTAVSPDHRPSKTDSDKLLRPAQPNCWDLPDLGSNLDLESNNHIPQFSDFEDDDDFDSIDIDKIKFLADVDNH